MLRKEDNDKLTRVGPGTPGGEFLRRYWQPVDSRVAEQRILDLGRADSEAG